MFTIEHEFDASVITLIDEGKAPLREDVTVQAFASVITFEQWDPRTNSVCKISLSPEQLHDLTAALNLPEDQRFVAFADTAGLLDFFAARGVSRDQARTCLADAGRLSEIADVAETYGTQDDITQTPTFVLNGKKLDDTSWTAIEAALQRAGAR